MSLTTSSTGSSGVNARRYAWRSRSAPLRSSAPPTKRKVQGGRVGVWGVGGEGGGVGGEEGGIEAEGNDAHLLGEDAAAGVDAAHEAGVGPDLVRLPCPFDPLSRQVAVLPRLDHHQLSVRGPLPI